MEMDWPVDWTDGDGSTGMDWIWTWLPAGLDTVYWMIMFGLESGPRPGLMDWTDGVWINWIGLELDLVLAYWIGFVCLDLEEEE